MISLDNVHYCVNDILNFFVGHRGVQRQRNNPLEMLFRLGEIPFLIAETLPISGHKVYGNEMYAGAYVSLVQLHDKLISVDGQ